MRIKSLGAIALCFILFVNSVSCAPVVEPEFSQNQTEFIVAEAALLIVLLFVLVVAGVATYHVSKNAPSNGLATALDPWAIPRKLYKLKEDIRNSLKSTSTIIYSAGLQVTPLLDLSENDLLHVLRVIQHPNLIENAKEKFSSSNLYYLANVLEKIPAAKFHSLQQQAQRILLLAITRELGQRFKEIPGVNATQIDIALENYAQALQNNTEIRIGHQLGRQAKELAEDWEKIFPESERDLIREARREILNLRTCRDTSGSLQGACYCFNPLRIWDRFSNPAYTPRINELLTTTAMPSDYEDGLSSWKDMYCGLYTFPLKIIWLYSIAKTWEYAYSERLACKVSCLDQEGVPYAIPFTKRGMVPGQAEERARRSAVLLGCRNVQQTECTALTNASSLFERNFSMISQKGISEDNPHPKPNSENNGPTQIVPKEQAPIRACEDRFDPPQGRGDYGVSCEDADLASTAEAEQWQCVHSCGAFEDYREIVQVCRYHEDFNSHIWQTLSGKSPQDCKACNGAWSSACATD